MVPNEGCTVRITAGPMGIRAVELNAADTPGYPQDKDHPLLKEATHQLAAYFAGKLRRFDLPLDMAGTGFQKRVWRALLSIPYGETRSYAFVAREIGVPRAARAVGAANGRNPIAIIVPCHRVIASDGSLAGYAGGLAMKRMLLELEKNHHEPA